MTSVEFFTDLVQRLASTATEENKPKKVRVTFTLNHGEHEQTLKMLNDIAETAANGHSFTVEVDKEDGEPRTYSFDGDGNFRLEDLDVNKVEDEDSEESSEEGSEEDDS